jgi:hypothetical protein
MKRKSSMLDVQRKLAGKRAIVLMRKDIDDFFLLIVGDLMFGGATPTIQLYEDIEYNYVFTVQSRGSMKRPIIKARRRDKRSDLDSPEYVVGQEIPFDLVVPFWMSLPHALDRVYDHIEMARLRGEATAERAKKTFEALGFAAKAYSRRIDLELEAEG